MASTGGTIHVLDGTAALFRAYYGMNQVKAPDGTEVGALLGLGQWLARFLRHVRPTHVAVVFDAGARTFRNELYPLYKANRGEPPPDLVPQFDLAPPVAEALGFPAFRAPGFEADDLMATMARRSCRSGRSVVLVTPDKDVLQLVGERVHVMDPKDFGRISTARVRERFGVEPAQLPDLQALAGDATDNIPGVKGVGLKTAQALIGAFGSLEALYRDPERAAALPVRGSRTLPERLRNGQEAASLSRRLVTLRDDVPLRPGAMKLGLLRWKGPSEEAEKLFDRLGFHQPLRTAAALASGQR